MDISQCKNLTVLYLQNNCLVTTDNLEHAHQLTHLYLQNNKIRKIENLNGLRKLRKLWVLTAHLKALSPTFGISHATAIFLRQHSQMWDLLYFGILRRVKSWFLPTCSDNHFGPSSRLKQFFLDWLNLEDASNRLSRNAGIYHSMLCKIAKEHRPHLHRGRSLRPHTSDLFLQKVF